MWQDRDPARIGAVWGPRAPRETPLVDGRHLERRDGGQGLVGC